jgi:quinol monooxygenase YgiN
VIVVSGHARVRPEARQRLIEAIVAVSAATKQDDGCFAYEFGVDLTDDAVIRNTEVWRDQAALDAHMAHDHTVAFLAGIGDCLDGDPVMEISSVS